MEQNFVVERSSGDQQSCESFSEATLPQISQSTKLQGKSKQEKLSLSYADLHHEITTNVKDDCTSIGSKNQEKEHVSGKLLKEEEIIKYMSNLPTYLERRSNLQEKGLNVGVLDWERLERWHSGQKQIPCRDSVSSSSSSNRSSAFSTTESSVYSSKGHASPGRLRVHCPSLQSPVIISPGEVGVKNQHLKPLQSNTVNGKQKVIGADRSSSKYRHYIESELLKRNCLLQKVVPEKMKQIGELTKIEDKLQKPDSGDIVKVPETDCFRNGDVPEINHVEIPVLKDSRLSLTEAGQKDLVEMSSSAGKSELNSEIPHSCQISCEGSRQNVLVVQQSMSGLKGTKPTSETSHSVKQTATRGVTPAKTRIFYGTKSIGAPADSRENKSSSGMELEESKVTVEKTRSFSPFSRLSIGLSRSKGSISIEDSDIPHQSSEKISVKPKSENAIASTNLDASSNDKRKSSPLRRLLDPILGRVNYHHPKSLERDSIEKNVKSSNLLPESSTVQSVKVKLDISRCRKIDVHDAAQDKRRGPTSTQALLQAAVKNGLPLLTFAVDNVSDVLAATMKLTSLGKEKYRIFTFFTIREVKKKNGSWINQGGKGKGRDYISNVVAQMKVSELQFSNLTRQDEFCAREFVLFSVDQKHSDQQNSDFLPINELAAIVIKIPFSISIRNELQRDALNDLAKTDSNVLFSGVNKSYSSSKANVCSQHSLGSEPFISTTVILPSGNHSLPSKGGPSSLIERWNTGGTCDCGGWDLGCKLRIFTSSNQVTKKSNSSENYSLIDQLLLFSQEGEVDNQRILSMTMLKDKIFSIEFGSSLTHLQAFSISIAFLDSWNLCDFSFEEKTLDESRAAQYGKLMTSNRVGEFPALPNPPLSPFGRV